MCDIAHTDGESLRDAELDSLLALDLKVTPAKRSAYDCWARCGPVHPGPPEQQGALTMWDYSPGKSPPSRRVNRGGVLSASSELPQQLLLHQALG